MISYLGAVDLNALAETVCQWVLHSILYGTVLAISTWVLLQFMRRRVGHALHGALWLIVLLKFVIPIGPSWSFSLASTVESLHGVSEDWSHWLFTSEQQPAVEANAETANIGSFLVIVDSLGGVAEATVQPQPDKSWPIATIIAVLYVLGVMTVGGRSYYKHRRFAARCRNYPPADAAARAVVERSCRRLGVSRVPIVRTSNRAPAPFILGALRPTLVLPADQLDRPGELEAVVLHEIAHLRRGDLFVRYLQWVAGTILFFWPVVAWVNRKIDLVREAACDNWALRHGQLSAGDYARCLLRAMHPARSIRLTCGAAAMAASKKHVERRIEMILENPSHTRRHRWIGVVAGVLLVAWGAFVLTGSAEARTAATVPAKAEDVKKMELKTQDGKRYVVVVDSKGTEAEVQVTVQKTVIGEGEDVVVQLDVHHSGAMLSPPHGGHFTWTADAGEAGNGQFLALAVMTHPSDKELAKFAEEHPTADADADGKVSPTEFKAYLVALAMSDPAAVLEQFPKADRNDNGRLEATEAARLVGIGGSHLIRHMKRFVPQGKDVVTFGELKPVTGQNVFLHRIETSTEEVEEDGQKQLKIIVRAEPETDVKVEGEVEIEFEITVEAEPKHMIAMALPRARFSARADAGHWLIENIDATPSATEVSNYITTVQQAPFAAILERHPEADADGDGVLSETERDSFFERQRIRSRAILLEKMPDLDADGDGEISDEELKSMHGKGAGAMFFGKGQAGELHTVTLSAEGEPGELHTVTLSGEGQGGKTKSIVIRRLKEGSSGELHRIIIEGAPGTLHKVVKLKKEKKDDGE